MKLLEQNFDNILKCDFELYSINFFELRNLAKSWYKEEDLTAFDNRLQYVNDVDKVDVGVKLCKQSGVLSNLFYAYKEGNRYYLLDGFNRLLSDWSCLEKDTVVYLKVITTELKDSQLMYLMFNLNLWKLYNKGYGGFYLTDFLDRGFRLLLKTKFNIELYNYKDYSTRVRNKRDLDLLEKYFKNEQEYSDSFSYSYVETALLFNNTLIIEDFKELISSNNYLEEPFEHYDMFLYGFAMFLSRQRLKQDLTVYRFSDFVEKLKTDSKFFKKLCGMSGNESTRKNIYAFYNKHYVRLKEND